MNGRLEMRYAGDGWWLLRRPGEEAGVLLRSDDEGAYRVPGSGRRWVLGGFARSLEAAGGAAARTWPYGQWPVVARAVWGVKVLLER